MDDFWTSGSGIGVLRKKPREGTGRNRRPQIAQDFSEITKLAPLRISLAQQAEIIMKIVKNYVLPVTIRLVSGT